VAFLGRRSLKALLAYLRFRPDAGDEDPLWTTRSGGRMAYTTLRDVLRRRARQAGVEPPSLHSMRRLFATASLASGADLLSVSRMLGHCNLATVRRYIRQLQSDLQAVHEKHSPVDKMLGVLVLGMFLWPLLRSLLQRG
jgi:site-specific recombinase XerD